MKIDNSTEIVSVTMIDIDTGEEKKLREREGSKCHFREKIELENNWIQLRVDWGDIRNEEPILDADIYSKTTGKKIKNGPWHQNEKKLDSNTGQRIYIFKFENLILKLGTRTTIAKDMKCDIRFSKKNG